MKQAIKRSVTAIILVALAIASGYGIQQIYYAVQAKNYPLAYTEYVENIQSSTTCRRRLFTPS